MRQWAGSKRNWGRGNLDQIFLYEKTVFSIKETITKIHKVKINNFLTFENLGN